MFTPTYLLVVDDAQALGSDRWHYVSQSRARFVFSQLHVECEHASPICFRLGEFAGTAISRYGGLPYVQNSPYVGVCLAAYMGATRIGLLGVDFTDDHFWVFRLWCG